MTVISADLPSRAGSLDLIARRSRARLRQHRIRPRLSVASEPFSRARQRRGMAAGTQRRCPARRRLAAAHEAERAISAANLWRARSSLAPPYTRSPQRSGARQPPKRARQLSAHYARCVAKAELAPGDLFMRLAWSVREGAGRGGAGADRARRGPAFTEGDLRRVKECGGHACGWVFYERPRTTGGDGARWKCAGIAPSRSGSRREGAAL